MTSVRLTNHLKTHEVWKSRPGKFICDICGARLRKKDNTARHMKVYHSGTTRIRSRPFPRLPDAAPLPSRFQIKDSPPEASPPVSAVSDEEDFYGFDDSSEGVDKEREVEPETWNVEQKDNLEVDGNDVEMGGKMEEIGVGMEMDGLSEDEDEEGEEGEENEEDEENEEEFFEIEYLDENLEFKEEIGVMKSWEEEDWMEILGTIREIDETSNRQTQNELKATLRKIYKIKYVKGLKRDCKYCGKVLASGGGLKRHINKMHPLL